MFDLNEFLLELDHMYATNPKGVEAYLKSGLEEAGKCLDGPAMLTILNELMGYYRVMSKPTECEWCIEKAVRIAGETWHPGNNGLCYDAAEYWYGAARDGADG